MSKRIAIVTPVFPPYRGGIGTVAELDARQLASLGFEVHVFVPAQGGTYAGPYTVHEWHPWLRYGKAALVPQAMSLLAAYDAVLLEHPFFGASEPLVAAKLLTGKGKLLVLYHMDVVGRGVVAAFAAPTRWCMPLVVRAAARMLVTSLDYARSGNLAGLAARQPQKFSELPISTDIVRFAPAPKSAALLAKYGIAPTDRVIVQLGGLDQPHYFKGVPFLLGALAQPALAAGTQRVRAVIVGDGDLRAQFEQLARDLGVADRVTFAGSVSDADLADHYRLADVFAFPSIDKSEAFGIAALEAAACGVPVVASNLAGVRTVVRDGVNGLLVPPSDAAALATALAALLGDETRRGAYGAAGRAMAEKEYSDAARLERWKKVLADVGLQS